MIEVYSSNVTVAADQPVPFENVVIRKGCSAVESVTSTIQLNRAGIYLVSADASSATAATIQLYKDGVAQPQAASTGTSPSFTTLVQVDRNNSKCCYSSPVLLQLMNSGEAEATYTDVNLTIVKIC